ncbi:MAG: glycoside hydrolase family 99-like domain-containing protein, partial [Armatimonadetes bacterium]|nr:glycoside hydrolase family 99-like domain-containing protein [Armatimonadota bacterium]
ALPRFTGHRQPIVPAWGYFDESDPAWAAREIDLAADHAVTCFLYDWYWYEDGPFLHDALDRGFLLAPNRDRLKFALMWANHTWIDIHPAKYINPKHKLALGEVSRSAFEQMTDLVINRYFTCPNYLRLDGAPYFSIYELGTFIRGLGGLDAAVEALADFRERARQAGLPGIHLNAVVFGLRVLPGESPVQDPVELVERLGFDSVGSYTWVHHYGPNTDGFPQGSYAAAMARNVALWDENQANYPVPYHPNVSMGWDPSPRTIATDRYDPLGYPFTAILDGNTPAAFQHALEQARDHLLRPDVSQKLLTINAWNEWTEGSYLLPDTVTGNAYLEAIRTVFGPLVGDR